MRFWILIQIQLGHFAAVVAIVEFLGGIVIRVFSTDNHSGRAAQNCYWVGLVALAVWMACEIGRIGL